MLGAREWVEWIIVRARLGLGRAIIARTSARPTWRSEVWGPGALGLLLMGMAPWVGSEAGGLWVDGAWLASIGYLAGAVVNVRVCLLVKGSHPPPEASLDFWGAKGAAGRWEERVAKDSAREMALQIAASSKRAPRSGKSSRL